MEHSPTTEQVFILLFSSLFQGKVISFKGYTIYYEGVLKNIDGTHSDLKINDLLSLCEGMTSEELKRTLHSVLPPF